MFLAICFYVVSAPPIAPAAEAAPVAPAWSGRIESIRPADGLRQALGCGEVVYIVAEKPVTRSEQYTAGYYSTCGMGCCLAPITKTRQIIVNGPTPLDQIEQGLAALELTAADVLYDLGSGDGRVAIVAAKRWGCRAVGIDRRAEAVELARNNARANGVAHLLRFYELDLFEANLDDATAVFAHLTADTLGRLSRRLPGHLRGAVSFEHKWSDRRSSAVGKFHVWRPVRAARRTASADLEWLAPRPDG